MPSPAAPYLAKMNLEYAEEIIKDIDETLKNYNDMLSLYISSDGIDISWIVIEAYKDYLDNRYDAANKFIKDAYSNFGLTHRRLLTKKEGIVSITVDPDEIPAEGGEIKIEVTIDKKNEDVEQISAFIRQKSKVGQTVNLTLDEELTGLDPSLPTYTGIYKVKRNKIKKNQLLNITAILKTTTNKFKSTKTYVSINKI